MKLNLFAILLTSIQIFGQNIDSVFTKIFPDSLSITINDSLITSNSLIISDSLEKKSNNDIDAVVFANAKDSLIFQVKNKEM